MLHEPDQDQWDSYHDLLDESGMTNVRVYFGRAIQLKEEEKSLPPIMAKIVGHDFYPEEPFIVFSQNTLFGINKQMGVDPVMHDWLRADCCEYFWRKEKLKNEYILDKFEEVLQAKTCQHEE